MGKKKYDLIFPIGEACSCSSTLRHANLQIQSFPFDWLFGSDFLSRIKILLNNFENLIRLEDIECTGDNGIPSHLCDIYTNRVNGLGFNHDFLHGADVTKEIAEVAAKYQRRAERLLTKAHSAEKILAVWVDSPGCRWFAKDNELFIEGQKLLQEKFPNARVDLLVFIWDKGRPIKKALTEQVSENITKYTFDYQFHHKKKVVADYVVDEKMLMKFLKNYELNMTTKEKVQNLIHKNEDKPVKKFILKLIFDRL